MVLNMVPSPRMHFVSCSHSPLFVSGQEKAAKMGIPEFTAAMWSKDNAMADIQLNQGRYLSASCIFRGSGLNRDDNDDDDAPVFPHCDKVHFPFFSHFLFLQISVHSELLQISLVLDGPKHGNLSIDSRIHRGYMFSLFAGTEHG